MHGVGSCNNAHRASDGGAPFGRCSCRIIASKSRRPVPEALVFSEETTDDLTWRCRWSLGAGTNTREFAASCGGRRVLSGAAGSKATQRRTPIGAHATQRIRRLSDGARQVRWRQLTRTTRDRVSTTLFSRSYWKPTSATWGSGTTPKEGRPPRLRRCWKPLRRPRTVGTYGKGWVGNSWRHREVRPPAYVRGGRGGERSQGNPTPRPGLACRLGRGGLTCSPFHDRGGSLYHVRSGRVAPPPTRRRCGTHRACKYSS